MKIGTFSLLACAALALLSAGPAAGATNPEPATAGPSWSSIYGDTRGIPLPNLAYLEPLAAFHEYQTWLNNSDAVLAIEEAVVMRIAGAGIVPFTLEKQRVLIEAASETIIQKMGPAEMVLYREGLPDPRSPDYKTESLPYVDVALNVYHLLTQAEIDRLLGNWDSNGTFENAFSEEYKYYLEFTVAATRKGINATMRLLSIDGAEVVINPDIPLRPIRMLQVYLAVSTPDMAGSTDVELRSDQITAVEDILSRYTTGWLTTFVAAYSYRPSDRKVPEDVQALGNGSAVVQLAVAVVACEGEVADDPDATCEQARLEEALQQLTAFDDFEEELNSAGIGGLRIVAAYMRPAPAEPEASSSANANGTLVPWHLDRLDQTALPLDNKFTASADGSGVNVYLLSSGIRADHEEFGFADGRPGTRIKSAWGFEGQDPLKDCEDAFVWYGFGTYAAGLIAGLKQGVAKNATVHSVRFRSKCLFESPAIWQPGGLPSAMDAVISAHQKPAIMVIDTWWSRNRLSGDDDSYIEKAILERLDRAYAAGIPVVVPAGIGLPSQTPCDNVLAGHPKSISVAGTNSYDHVNYLGPSNSSCITLFAPGGEAARSIVSAHPVANNSYLGIIPRAFGGAWLAAGVAAQYLQLHPKASPDEVKAALVAWSTPDVIVGARQAPNILLYTNFTAPAVGSDPKLAVAQNSGAGLSDGAIAGIAIAAFLAIKSMLLTVYFVRRHRRRVRRRRSPLLPYSKGGKTQFEPPPVAPSDWEILPDQIAITKLSDGSDWELGRGSYGRVFRAVKDEVQVVAVKTIAAADATRRELFVREIALMKYVSRDPNIVQFYGACVSGPEMMLVVEYMAGGDLRAALTADRAGELRWWRLGKGIALDIVRGLHFLHSSNVIHRDIKSKNILLTKEGRAKITDVGLARVFEGENYFTDGAMGTFAWAGPEMLLGERCTEKVDIYSLGVVLWELATQEVPIRGALRTPAVPTEVPQEVVAVIEACMQRDPAKRPSAREVYERLHRCPPLDNLPESLPSTSVSIASSPQDSLDSKSQGSKGEVSPASEDLPASPLPQQQGTPPTPRRHQQLQQQGWRSPVAASSASPVASPALQAVPPTPATSSGNPAIWEVESQIRDRMLCFNAFAAEAAATAATAAEPAPAEPPQEAANVGEPGPRQARTQ